MTTANYEAPTCAIEQNLRNAMQVIAMQVL